MVVIASSLWDRLDESGAWTIPEKMLRTAVVYFAIVILLRIFGKRELAQLNSFDLVVLLLLSNVVQNAIIGPDNSLWGGLVGAATLLFLNIGRGPGRQALAPHRPALRRPEERDRHGREVRRARAHAAGAPAR